MTVLRRRLFLIDLVVVLRLQYEMPDSLLTSTSTPNDQPQSSKLTVAIDGPAGAGKSAVARRLAAELGALYIDTGAMYRAVAYTALAVGTDLQDPLALAGLAEEIWIELLPPTLEDPDTVRVLVDGKDITGHIRTPVISQITSAVSAVSGVRKRLVDQQRKMADSTSVVMEGRDIGTVVLPNADVKIFLTATPEERARRRQLQLEQSGKTIDFRELVREIMERDNRDSTRADSPLVAAADAETVWTDGLTEDEVVLRLAALCRKKAKQ
jgi:cytidylate kinase